jgi:sec-independent protein translocase protein TatC
MPDEEPGRVVHRNQSREESSPVSESGAPPAASEQEQEHNRIAVESAGTAAEGVSEQEAGSEHPGAGEPPADPGTATAPEDQEIQLYGGEEPAEAAETAGTTAALIEAPAVVAEHPPQPSSGGGGGQPPSSSGGGGGGDGDDEEEGEEEQMVKMSFLEHLEELRRRIIHSLMAVAAGFFICFAFAQQIFEHMAEPLRAALRGMKLPNGQPIPDTLYFSKPTDAFTLYLNLALVAGLFLSSPVVLYEVWAFIAPGLYKRERKYAFPFVFFCSGLFIAGGAFGYFIAFPFALKFLVSYGGPHVTPWITITEYMDMFWTVILGLGIVFELPILMLFLGLLGILKAGFLMRHFRYAVLVIFIAAAVITPTSDITNMMIFAMPMLALYLVGVGLVWLVGRRRARRSSH